MRSVKTYFKGGGREKNERKQSFKTDWNSFAVKLTYVLTILKL